MGFIKVKILKNKDLKLIVSESVTEVTPDLQFLAINMLATMKLNNGIGLSGPQIGRYIKVVVFDVYGEYGYMFNPEIINSSETVEQGTEGCLSFPNEFCEVTRSTEVTVKYLDLSNKIVVRSFKGIAARVLQHEIDHLHGITMHDREIKNET